MNKFQMAEEFFQHPFQCSTVLRNGDGQGQQLVLVCRERLYQIDTTNWKKGASWCAGESMQKSAISILKASNGRRHCAAVSGEDKTVHVFESDGLKHLHQVTMPKRPCALAFSPEDDYVLCGDKFGDVHALPVDISKQDQRKSKKAQVGRMNAPAATNLTVHTKGNLKALEHQHRMAKDSSKRGQPTETEELFLHEPILGHVSMLTDIATVQADVVTLQPDNKPRSRRHYIASADRDEHIRISRGLPQAHVIEGFCLGHTQFVNKLCFINNNLLVSGGGDNYLCVWDWLRQELLCKLNLSRSEDESENNNKPATSFRIAVSGIWLHEGIKHDTAFFCACEGMPNLWYFRKMSRTDANCDFQRILIPLAANPLSLSVIKIEEDDTDEVLVTVDNVHNAGSISTRRQNTSDCPRLQIFKLAMLDGSTQITERPQSETEQIGAECETDSMIAEPRESNQQLSSLLYGTEHLRKRGGEDAELM